MLVAAAVLPHPPLLIPEVAVGAAPELHDLRAGCFDVLRHVRQVWSDGADMVLVGSGPRRDTFTPGAVGTFAGFGVPVTTTLPGPKDLRVGRNEHLPLSLSVGAWLMQQIGTWDRDPEVAGSVWAESVAHDWPSAHAVALGRELAASADRVALVAMGDGSSALSESAPGYVVPGAREWQNGVQKALTHVDTSQLVALDPVDAVRFGAAGRVPWQVLAGAVGGSDGWQAESATADERYGVGYLAVRWFRAGGAR
jgi:hypothetical protein